SCARGDHTSSASYCVPERALQCHHELVNRSERGGETCIHVDLEDTFSRFRSRPPSANDTRLHNLYLTKLRFTMWFPVSRFVQIDGGLAFGESQGGLGRGLTSCALADIGGPASETDQQLIAGGVASAPVPFIEHETQWMDEIPTIVVFQYGLAHLQQK